MREGSDGMQGGNGAQAGDGARTGDGTGASDETTFGDRFDTRAIHGGLAPDPQTGAVMTPIYASSTFAQDAPGEDRGYEYSRTGNPTRDALEANLASLEGGAHGRAFASGMAAIATVLNLLEAGDHVVVGRDVYGGTHRMFTQVYAKYDLAFDFVDATDPTAVADAVTPATAVLWIETPTNPLLRVVDVAAIAEIADAADALSVVDNTFATPALQQPLELGADVVAHSLTKYLGGHSDVVGGALVTDDPALDERLGFYQNSVGATLSPFAAFLVLRGIKTLPLRMARHSATARDLATWLAEHEAIESVHYPGLEDHPQHALAATQMADFGGMVSVEIAGSLADARTVVSETRVFTLAESLGGVESLVEHPASMTHAAIPSEEREANGITDGLLRLSVGLEDPRDLQADLDQALSVV